MCLKMDARLFFAMLSRGRLMEFRRKSRDFYEMCRTSDFPHITKESRDKMLSYHWDNSLSELEMQMRDAKIAKIKEDAKAHYQRPEAALKFFSQGKALAK